MLAEDLIALAMPHGVDLERLARQSTAKAAREVVMVRFQSGRWAPILQRPPRNQAHGKESPSVVRQEWTLAEIGQASGGMPDVWFRAACYGFAGDRSCYWPLHRALWDEGVQLRDGKGWSPVVLDVHGLERTYLAHLAKMVLDEDHSPGFFKVCPQLYAIYLGVTDKTWDAQLVHRFNAIKGIWSSWLGSAARIIQARLSGDEG